MPVNAPPQPDKLVEHFHLHGAQSCALENSSTDIPSRPRNAVEIENCFHPETGALQLFLQFLVRVPPVAAQSSIERPEHFLPVRTQPHRAPLLPQPRTHL